MKTAIEIAIEANNVSALESLITAENIDKPEYYIEELDTKVSAIQLATYFGHEDTVDFLAKKNANINAITVEEETFFQTAGRFLSFGFWIREGGFTALHIAGIKDHKACIRTLLSNGANYRIKDKRAKLPLTLSQLCRSYSINELDLSIYGEFKPEYINLIKDIFSTRRIKKIKLKLPNIHLDKKMGLIGRAANVHLLVDNQHLSEAQKNSDNSNELNLFLTLLSILKNNPHFSEIILDVRYIINTELNHALCYLSPDNLAHIRSGMVQILNALLELKRIDTLERVDLGIIEHVHTVIKPSSYPVHVNGSTEIRTSTSTELRSNEILHLCNDRINAVSADPVREKEALDKKNESIMQAGDAWVRMFSSDEGKSAKKILDSEVIIPFCLKFSDFLQNRRALLVSSGRPTSSLGPVPKREYASTALGTSTEEVAAASPMSTNVHRLFNSGSLSAIETNQIVVEQSSDRTPKKGQLLHSF